MGFPVRQRVKLIVGIDYGTTYSGLSFAPSDAADFKDIVPWTSFPGVPSHGSRHCEKAPSRIAYKSENPDDLNHDVWGYETEPGLKLYSWTKLMLDNSALPSEYDDPNLKRSIGDTLMQLPAGKTAKDVVTDYLRGMYAMFLTAVEERFGREETRDLPMDIWLTVPATWSEKAKLLTQAAAKDAGFGSRSIDRIMLIPEPEAAAHMALKISFNHVHDLVDDITTYEIQSISPTLRLKELCVGNGGKCGGTFVDRNLYELLAKRFGRAFTSLPLTETGPGSEFANQFEDKKKNFSIETASKRPTKLNLKMEGLEGIRNLETYYDQAQYKVLITRQDMQSLFDPVVDKILQLVADQERRTRKEAGKPIETIVLVGGFGSSPYVKDKLKDWYGRLSLDQAPETIECDRVEKVGVVEYTLDDLDIKNENAARSIVRDGKTMYEVQYVLKIKMSDETGLLVFRIMTGGREVGRAKLAFVNS
ncbi:hypothetical protein K4K58_012203 [Colletotrichum sp. SAR11_239]|nr:hypothetical protein K4K58_012203 [Colletotrichum sp. SAR11_239]